MPCGSFAYERSFVPVRFLSASARVASVQSRPMPARKAKYTWRFVCAAPVREVFAVTEQMVGTPPYRFDPTGPESARIVEFERKHFLFGQFSKKVRNPRWIDVAAREVEAGTEVVVTAVKGKATKSRALQVVQLLTRGVRDRRTIYR